MPVRRVRHLLEWVREGGYDRIVGGDYIRRGQEPPLRDEADAAQEHYAKRDRRRLPAGRLVDRRGRPAARRLAVAPARRRPGRRRRRAVAGAASSTRRRRASASRRRSTPRRSTRQTFICDMPMRRAISRWDMSPAKYRRMTSRSSGSSMVESSSSQARSKARRSPSSSIPSWSPTVRSSASAWAGASSDSAQRPRRASMAATTRSIERSRCSARSDVVGAWPSVALRRSVADEQLEPRLGRLARRAHGPRVVAQPAAHLADHGRHGVADEVGAEAGVEALERLGQAERGGLLEVLDVAGVAIAARQAADDRPHARDELLARGEIAVADVPAQQVVFDRAHAGADVGGGGSRDPYLPS